MASSLRCSILIVGALSALVGVSAAPLPQEVVVAKPGAPGANVLQPLSKVAKWRLQTFGTAKASLTRSGETATVTTTASDGTDFHVQLAYVGSVLQEGGTYVLSFRAKADPARKMAVDGIVNAGDFHNVGLFSTVDVGTDFQTYTYKFLATGAGTTPLLCPQFLLGASAGSLTLSDVSLALADSSAPTDAGNWFMVNTDPGKATLANDGTAKTVTVTQAGTEDWHVQLNRSIDGLKDDRPYVVHFRAKADPPRDMAVSGQANSGDYHSITGYLIVRLSTDWKPFDFTLVPHNSAGKGSYFPQFLLGKKAGTVWLDGVTVKPEAPDPVAEPTVYAPKAGELRAEGVIQTAGFGPDGFTLLVSRLVRPGGGVTPLSPARAKPVRLTADTQFRSLTDGSQLYLATLKPGDTVSIIGPDLGVGKSLPARLMLR